MLKRSWVNLFLVFLPLLAGIIEFVLINIWAQALPPFMVTADFGIFALVFGMTIRNLGLVALLMGMFITGLLLIYYNRAIRRQEQTQRQVEEAKRDAEQGRRRFLRRLDHEIKNPLTGLRTALVNMQEVHTNADRQRAVDNANNAVERLTRLLTDLRKLSDLGERPIELWQVDVPDLLQDVVDAAHSLPAYEGREVNLLIPRVPSPFPAITGDRDLLVLAIYNLVENALKFTCETDSVEIRLLEDGRSILIEVADSGAGIPAEDASKIFEELYRGSNARSTEGSGLGLALVHRIIALHGGRIDVRSSQEEPRGTVFTIRLPVTKKGFALRPSN
ncbi:MAG TPA: HAMP domain-containing sensor histidine kinase [Anaerolineales bacterium]|jgi:two-component system OmpR family sensor kinase|nr:HAMP domain-containing sensor histidine kinase [Anaerolineales bacterium]